MWYCSYYSKRFHIESMDQNPSFNGLVRSDASEILEGADAQIPQEPSAQWDSGGSSNLPSGLDDANPQYPYLPTVLENPSSSFSKVGEDDPLPAVEGLQITGEAFPGRELQANGYSIHGTTSCNFEWVRCLANGSINLIEGAKEPTYLVTADDVDCLLAVEVQPLDDRKRKGETVKVYANDLRNITCDPETMEHIKNILSTGHVSYEVLLLLFSVGFWDKWEPAVLAINREGYSVKFNGQRDVITEKFQQALTINIPFEHPTEFSIMSADGPKYNLKPAENAPNHNMTDVPQGTDHASGTVRFNIESMDQNPSFKDLVVSEASENLEGADAQIPQEPSAQWDSGGSPNLASGLDDANPQYPYLLTALEKLSSSFSKVAEDDPLPAIEGLRITGEAFPGRKLQASGYSIHGTTSCNFEWVRHLDDGSMNLIEGAKEPTYLVTADDVDCLLAVEVQPLDDRKRKGEIVKVYANDQRNITCDPETMENIKKILSTGHVSYEVLLLLSVRFLDMWEPAVLAINREGYSVKCNGHHGVVTEKFQQAMTINIPFGRPTEFSIVPADSAEYNLKPAKNAPLLRRAREEEGCSEITAPVLSAPLVPNAVTS